jgi:hypothetical protein
LKETLQLGFMDSSTTIEQGNLVPKTGTENPGSTVFSALIQAADREFLATAQLLAERARFVAGARGVAIALKRDGKFIYCAACGESGHKADDPVNLASKVVGECIASNKTIRSSADDVFSLAVPIHRAQILEGFFELTATHEFNENDVESVARLTQMLTTALELQESAQATESRMLKDPDPKPAVEPAPQPEPPKLWHAEEQKQEVVVHEAPAPQITKVSACRSCGFPVSSGRVLCVDCEQRAPHPSLVPSGEMFSQTQQENWLSSHGYTIASLAITALAAAIIYWLRVR